MRGEVEAAKLEGGGFSWWAKGSCWSGGGDWWWGLSASDRPEGLPGAKAVMAVGKVGGCKLRAVDDGHGQPRGRGG